MAEQGFQFDKNTIIRIANTVKNYERQGITGSNTPSGVGKNPPYFYAKLNAEDSSNQGHYSWTKQDVINGVLQDSSPLVQDTAYTASSFNADKGITSGTAVQLYFVGYDDNHSHAPRYLFSKPGTVALSILTVTAQKYGGTYWAQPLFQGMSVVGKYSDVGPLVAPAAVSSPPTYVLLNWAEVGMSTSLIPVGDTVLALSTGDISDATPPKAVWHTYSIGRPTSQYQVLNALSAFGFNWDIPSLVTSGAL